MKQKNRRKQCRNRLNKKLRLKGYNKKKRPNRKNKRQILPKKRHIEKDTKLKQHLLRKK
jgi:hypothetical protein